MEKGKIRGFEHRKLQIIASNYNYSLRRIKDLKRNNELSPSTKAIIEQYEHYVYHIDEIYRNFNMLEKTILDREYFSTFPKGWWEDVYPRSTFYRIRLLASKRFLELY